MAAGAPLILDLLTYIEQVERVKKKPAFTVPTEYFVAYQRDLRGLPGLKFNIETQADDIWLRIPRLREVLPPNLNENLRLWVTLTKSAEKLPTLKSELISYEGQKEISRELLEDRQDIRDLFARYVENQWEPWASSESPRRKTIGRYNQLFSLQQALASDGADTPLELVWGVGYATWKKDGFATVLKHPLLGQACEISLNEDTFDLEIRPRDVEPRLEVDCYAEMQLPGVRQLEAFWKSALANGEHRLNPFEDSTFDGVLKAAVGHLDPTGSYEVLNDDMTPPGPGDTLKITNTWVIFARKRSSGIFLEDIRRLKESVAAATSLPNVVRSFVEPGDSDVHVPQEQVFRGMSSSDSLTGAFELYFPMAYNEEQVSIVQKLEHGNGVVVQGPPGTGKTHTIANIICHYLAQGKRVLITSKGESALTEVLRKLPERIRPLSVALLSSERDGMKQFEHSIQTIASSVAAMKPNRAAAEIASLEQRLNQLHAKISHVDHSVAAFANQHMRNYTFQGKEVSPEEMAKLVISQTDDHQWLDDDLPANDANNLAFNEGDISSLRQARLKVGVSLGYLRCSLPATDDFPAWSSLSDLHSDLIKARAIESDLVQGTVLRLLDSTFETFEKAKALIAFLDRRSTLMLKLASAPQSLLETFRKRLEDMRPDDPILSALSQACADIQALDVQRKGLLSKAVEVPQDAELNGDFREASGRLAAGKSAFRLPFGKVEARKLVAAVRVLGSPPESKEEWELVKNAVQWRTQSRRSVALWNSIATDFGQEAQMGSLDTAFKKIFQWQGHIEKLRELAFDYDAKLHGEFESVFGSQTADRMLGEGETFVTTATESLQVHVDKSRLNYAMNRVGELVHKLNGHKGVVVEELRSFLTEALGNESNDEGVLHNTWLSFQTELSRLSSLRPALNDIVRVSGLIETAGATKWANRVRTEAAASDRDLLVPPTWQEAWNWRCAVMFLESLDVHQKLRELFGQRQTLTTALAQTYQDLVAEKTWLGVFNNSPDLIRRALQAYLNAVQAMGTGVGVRAIRYRRDAREAMTRAYQAVPCWILPEWRVSETIPSEVGLFDLVIIDEASQSDISALPALLRGKKLLVVGDHKQVSPSAIGVAEDKITELRSRFLENQPHKSEMTPDKSIYDLARVVFAGNSVMLTEHFRCVPAIIEFSNREFYQGDIKPLRLPRANERLDPPLIDVFVKGGYRKGDVNAAEAKAVVDEIEAILKDEEMTGRTIGVVTLLGTAQAACIQGLVSNSISPVDVIARNIAIGPPAVFQGRERDIMLVSMVLGPGDHAAQNRADQKQRFNVALSRARDRMYLFRSVEQSEFGEDTLNGKLMRHFSEPFRQDARSTQSLRDRCASGFELAMFDELTKKLQYRVQPQVRCAAYRIDFVIEGREGRRLAVECDGDRFHGPGQWSDDMVRQRVLERAGWTFWRCFASSFVRRKDEVMNDLVQTLESLGIEPLGSEFVDNTVWVASRVVDPFSVEIEEEVCEVAGHFVD